jgi:outer membrane protein assembly factor BamB
MLMKKNGRFFTTCVHLLGILCLLSVARAQHTAQDVKQILDVTGVKGGLIIHLGCGDGKLTAALCGSESYLVHGLDTDATNIAKAREHIKSLGLYGKVSVERWTEKHLPYTDNLVNLVVSQDLDKISMDEVMRVLCPNGVAYIKRGGKWEKVIKPRSGKIDEWTHYLHGPDNNAVSNDSVVGPPRHVQWVGSPKWSRHHDRMASMSALVSAGGRIFYIFDEGPTASIQFRADFKLIARDAFNGTILWKRPIRTWFNHLVPYKSGHGQLPRRLVAVGERVYVTTGLNGPVTALDAATGKVVTKYGGSDLAREIIVSDGVLFVLKNNGQEMNGNEYRFENTCMHEERDRVADEYPWDEEEDHILAIDLDTKDILWVRSYPVMPLTLGADAKCVYFHDGERIICLNRDDGKEVWRSEEVSRKSKISTNFGATLVVQPEVVLFSGGDRSMTAICAKTGKTFWTSKHPASGHHSPEDLLVVGGLAWAGAIAGGRDSGIFTGRDPLTGRIKRKFAPDIKTYWFHHRCYRSKATERYLLTSRTGVEFVDLKSEHWSINHWVRGGCIYGIMPSNGLLYAPPHSCACYIDAKLNGFCVLAPNSMRQWVSQAAGDVERLEKGPAYGKICGAAATEGESDWPTYRHDGSRSGRTRGMVVANLSSGWTRKIGEGKLSSVVVAGGKLYVAAIDEHTLYALDADTGKVAWSYMTGGRVDSPPTIYEGCVLFGSADGWVYCLRAADGKLVWRFRAAPVDKRVMSFEQLESVWPVHGSVLVHDGTVQCVAGRSMFLDGGLRMLWLDAKTGNKVLEKILDEVDPETQKNLQVYVKGLNMPTSLPDVLSTDGQSVYMRTQRFDMKGNRRNIAPMNVSEQDGNGVHLFCGAGFLDNTWFHRAYWTYGKSIASGANGWYMAGRKVPAGHLLVVDDESVYGFARKPQYYKWTTPVEYHLFSSDKKTEIVNLKTGRPATKADLSQKTEKCVVPVTRVAFKWSTQTPMLVRAMVLADKTLFVAGTPDVLNEEAVFRNREDAALQVKMDEQVAALEGKKGAILWAVSANNGEKLSGYKLDAMPVFDGMAAANGKLYMAMADGSVECWKGK